MLLALGFGFILAIANLVLRDTGNALGMALTVGMFLTPVLYPAPVRWPFFLVNVLNPLSPFVTATQDLIAIGYVSRPDNVGGGMLVFVSLGLRRLARFSRHDSTCRWLRLEPYFMSIDPIISVRASVRNSAARSNEPCSMGQGMWHATC